MEILNEVLSLVVLGFTVEAVVETLKMTYVKGRVGASSILSLCVGILVALATSFDLLVLLGFDPVFPIIGIVLAGILLSRGGNFVHEWYGKIKGENK